MLVSLLSDQRTAIVRGEGSPRCARRPTKPARSASAPNPMWSAGIALRRRLVPFRRPRRAAAISSRPGLGFDANETIR